MGRGIRRLTLRGYKSIRNLDGLELHDVNVLIGANGCGKSNFVSFFHLLRELIEGRLAMAVNTAGGADTQLFLGPKVTKAIEARLDFGVNGYEFRLVPTADDRLIFGDERIRFEGEAPYTRSVNRSLGSGQSESTLKEQVEQSTKNKAISEHVYNAIASWTVYHFHDTSEAAAMRRSWSIRDSERLRADAGNLAPFLSNLLDANEPTYRLIVETIKLVAPYFKEFRFRPRKRAEDEVVQLEWTQEGSDYPFHPSQLSDGTLRFICLATALLQPNPPATILIDEPELGLHPFALEILGDLILQARERTQLIVSTQSASLLNSFDPDHVIVVEREGGESQFKRLDQASLTEWLEEYTLGELWQKNVYGGGPTHG